MGLFWVASAQVGETLDACGRGASMLRVRGWWVNRSWPGSRRKWGWSTGSEEISGLAAIAKMVTYDCLRSCSSSVLISS